VMKCKTSQIRTRRNRNPTSEHEENLMVVGVERKYGGEPSNCDRLSEGRVAERRNPLAADLRNYLLGGVDPRDRRSEC
jgi:hypothetical protein